MKNNVLLPIGVALLFIFQGCTKRGLSPFPGNTVDYCSIQSLTFLNSLNQDTVSFVYDVLGRPIRGNRPINSGEPPGYLFRYDDQGRLQDFIGTYQNGAAEFWTRYFYDDGNRTVRDTTYTLAAQYVSWPPIYYGSEEPAVKHYDELGRIVSRTSSINEIIDGIDSAIIVSTQNFTYDRQGNVEGGGGYDNKINIHRTNWVWQFIDDQYSTNNPYQAQQYNNYGLPTEINYTGVNSPGVSVLFNLNYPQSVVHYSCDAPGGPSQKGR
jgi:hypothetical protein